MVVDEFGGNVGIVTLQHVVAEVIGRLPDEFGLGRRKFQRLDEDGFLVDGGMAIYEMRALAGLEWKDEDVSTVGGYVVRRLGRLPRALASNCASTATLLRWSKPTIVGFSNLASALS